MQQKLGMSFHIIIIYYTTWDDVAVASERVCCTKLMACLLAGTPLHNSLILYICGGLMDKQAAAASIVLREL